MDWWKWPEPESTSSTSTSTTTTMRDPRLFPSPICGKKRLGSNDELFSGIYGGASSSPSDKNDESFSESLIASYHENDCDNNQMMSYLKDVFAYLLARADEDEIAVRRTWRLGLKVAELTISELKPENRHFPGLRIISNCVHNLVVSWTTLAFGFL